MLTAKLLRKIMCFMVSFLPVTNQLRGVKIIYLTFDDGPDPEHSNKIMDVLAQYNIKATFFLVGTKMEKHFKTVKRMVREGHVIGNHTNTHKVFTSISRAERIDEIEKCQNKIENLQSSKTKLFRPPQGLINVSDLLYLLSNKYRIMLWSIDSNDHLRLGEIESRLRNMTKLHNVILFHDDNNFCIDSLSNLLPFWIEQGFQFAVPILIKGER